MMNSAPLTNRIPFNNILYIGDEAKACINIIEKFNSRLAEIEQAHPLWFNYPAAAGTSVRHDKLQYHIHYHFEGGIAVFRFRNEESLPQEIRNECRLACRALAAEQELHIA